MSDAEKCLEAFMAIARRAKRVDYRYRSVHESDMVDLLAMIEGEDPDSSE